MDLQHLEKRPDVLNALAFSQDFANNKFSTKENLYGWFSSYKSCLMSLGSTTKQSPFPDLHVFRAGDVDGLAQAVLKAAAEDQMSRDSLKQLENAITALRAKKSELKVKGSQPTWKFSIERHDPDRAHTDDWTVVSVLSCYVLESLQLELYCETLMIKLDVKKYSQVKDQVEQYLRDKALEYARNLDI
ncbi:uncharacterized protein LOC134176591 [Corticium candelabrum]|uniref:uncharacterized protein LOC134176591 n=1 Tax=Corticium candelabrum TaxID=121492 RepID=UPI002E262B91|nr:uncharacterized protein LOC134176591 [Corticium candelabrum]